MNIRERALLEWKEGKKQYAQELIQREIRVKEKRSQELISKIKKTLPEIEFPDDDIDIKFRDDLKPIIEIEGIIFSLAYSGPYDYCLITVDKCNHCQEYIQKAIIDSWSGLGASLDPNWKSEYIYRHENGKCLMPEDKEEETTTPEAPKSPLDMTLRELFKKFTEEKNEE